MSPLTGPVLAAAMLLLATGAVKIVRPDGTAAALVQLRLVRRPRALARGIGIIETVVGATVLVAGGPGPAAALAVTYAAFTAFVVVALRLPRRIRTCGCAGTDVPPTKSHAAVTAALAAAAAVAAVVGGVPSVPGVFVAAGPAESGVLVAYAGLITLLAWAVVAVLPRATRTQQATRREPQLQPQH